MPTPTSWLASLLLLGTLACQGQQPEAPKTSSPLFNTMLGSLLKGSVPFVSVQGLKAQPAPVLLDARAAPEYAVSHLRGARWVGYDDFSLSRVQDLPRHTPIVVYCSVGFRSEKVGEKLQQAGFTNVRNLYGGLFEWVNEGQPTVGANGHPTAKVHAYSRTWGVWLRRGEKVY
ncbi:hypothetical protein GCM10023185_30110 [Hymenobacter saemangeumensis]|uniref:Rhodanese domain-containing protein n=1 Tax=Hymenobacter saemangeumensis TaxID=1084522 RepID=A0ABP8ILB8_9BACT